MWKQCRGNKQEFSLRKCQRALSNVKNFKIFCSFFVENIVKWVRSNGQCGQMNKLWQVALVRSQSGYKPVFFVRGRDLVYFRPVEAK